MASSLMIVANAEECPSLLRESIKIADGCLAQLELNEKNVQTASLYSNEKIAAILEMNDQLKIDNRNLQEKNFDIQSELKHLKQKYSLLEGKLLKVNSIKRLNADKASKDATMKIEKINDAVVGKNIPSVRSRNFLHYRSAALKKKYSGFSKEELFKLGIYRVDTYMANIRYGHSPKHNISNVMRRGELLEFSEAVHIKDHIVWLKTKQGWIYVPNKKDALAILNQRKSKYAVASL